MKKAEAGSEREAFESSSLARTVSFGLVRGEEPNRIHYHYIKSKIEDVGSFFSAGVKELYNILSLPFSLDAMDWSIFKKYIWPTVSSGAALLLGDYLTQGLSEQYTGNPDYAFVFKFLLGAAILGYCALNRLTDKRFNSTLELSLAVAHEVMAITYMYSSIFTGTTFLLKESMSPEYLLIVSLGASALVVPGGVSYLAQKAQELLIRRQYNKGAQRSDSAMISSGLTSLSNMYFQLNHFMATELMISSRLFQLGLISHNIRHAHEIVNKFRNLPALLADLTPSIIKQMRLQNEKLAKDYDHNNKPHKVLSFKAAQPILISIPRYKLRTGDLVLCDNSIDVACVQISGELIALERNEEGNFTQNLQERTFGVNLKAQNGEDVMIEHKTKLSFESAYDKVELHAVKDRKQPGVLVGDKLDLHDHKNMFIQIKPEKEFLRRSHKKEAVINLIISERKQKSVLYAILGSVIMAAFIKRSIVSMPGETLKLMFSLFQTLIPFSEAFLREVVNSRLMKILNTNLQEQPFETIDALRVVDLFNALGGYYRDRFTNGVAIISDKTGTLTTTKMDVLGLWTGDMSPSVQEELKKTNGLLLPGEEEWLMTFEIFCSAYTNNTKELEPEEYAILNMFKSLLGNNGDLKVTIQGNNHYRKTIISKGNTKEIDTFHLGLYRTFGGRLSLVKDGVDYYLVFCGVPKKGAFRDMPLFQDYNKMETRIAVLSRDWCLGRSKLSESDYTTLHNLFKNDDDEIKIEDFILRNQHLLKDMKYFGTFIIDNPVKKGAEHFIAHCRDNSVPVFVATGDTVKAAENIAKVLCPEYANTIIKFNAGNIAQDKGVDCPDNATVIFSGVNKPILAMFKKLMDIDKAKRPVIIFAEMSTKDKGTLALYLKGQNYFIVANGDGENDVFMMQNANVVIAHQSDDGSFAPGVRDLSDISEEQLRRFFRTKKSFYELFSINDSNNFFAQIISRLAYSQEKPMMTLTIKGVKFTFELAKSLGVYVREMSHQHWYSVAFDLMWLWISFYEINKSADLPMDNRNINASRLIFNTMGIVLIIAIFQSLANYALYEEATNLTSMLIMLSLLPFVLKCVFSGFREVQNNLYPQPKLGAVDDNSEGTPRRPTLLNYVGTFFGGKLLRQAEGVKLQQYNGL